MQNEQTTILLDTTENDMVVQNHKLAMTVAIISWSMLFATLLLGYFVFRFSQTVWPPLGINELPLLLPNLSLMVVLASSMTFFLALRCYKTKNYKLLRLFNGLTLLLGFAYMLIQFKFWESLNAMNLLSSSNIFASILHGFTWIHAGHMVFALIALIFGIIVLRKDEHVVKWQNYINNVAIFWHFLTIVWVVLYFTLFVFL